MYVEENYPLIIEALLPVLQRTDAGRDLIGIDYDDQRGKLRLTYYRADRLGGRFGYVLPLKDVSCGAMLISKICAAVEDKYKDLPKEETPEDNHDI